MALTTNQVAYYKMDNGALTTDAVGGFTLTNNNSVSNTSSGKIGYGADFSSANTNKSLNVNSNLGIAGTGDSTVSLWLNVTTQLAADNEQGYIFDQRTTSGSDKAVSLLYQQISGTKRLTIYVETYPFPAGTWYDVTLTPGTWYHVVLTRSGTTVKLYLNGTLVITATPSYGSGSGNTFTIASAQGGSSSFFSGKVDEVGVWTRAITSTEVTELYNSGTGKQYPYAAAYTQSLTETLVLVEGMAKRTSKGVLEIVTMVDGVTKRTTRMITEAVTLVAGSTAGKISTKTLGDAISLADGATAKITAKILSEAIALVDAIAARFSVKYLTDSLSLQDAVVATRLYARAFVEAISLNDTIAQVIALGRHFYETISITIRWQALKNGLNIKNVRRYLNRAGTNIKRYLDIP